MNWFRRKTKTTEELQREKELSDFKNIDIEELLIILREENCSMAIEKDRINDFGWSTSVVSFFPVTYIIDMDIFYLAIKSYKIALEYEIKKEEYNIVIATEKLVELKKLER